jgi:hypothetical protein
MVKAAFWKEPLVHFLLIGADLFIGHCGNGHGHRTSGFGCGGFLARQLGPHCGPGGGQLGGGHRNVDVRLAGARKHLNWPDALHYRTRSPPRIPTSNRSGPWEQTGFSMGIATSYRGMFLRSFWMRQMARSPKRAFEFNGMSLFERVY